MKELGTVPIEPISFIHKVKQKLGLAPKELKLSIETLSVESTLEIVASFQKIKAMENETNDAALEVLEKNTSLFVHLITVAVCFGNEQEAKKIKVSIRKHWDIAKTTNAVNIIYEALDFNSMFGTLAMLGKIKSMIKVD